MVTSCGKILISVLISIVCLNISENFSQSINFKHLTVEDGLSNNDVNTLIQDKTGFIWFGTEAGLNRFDGYGFKLFLHSPTDSNSLSSNVIWSLLEDREGNIWVGTVDGILNQFDPISEKFNRWDFAGEDKKYCSITAIFEDQNGYLWIGTRSRGVYKLNPDTKEILNYRWRKKDKSSMSHTTVRSIIEDNNGNIIIGTYNGLNKFNPDQPDNGFEKFFFEDNNPNSLSGSQIYNISRSSSRHNIFWIGTPEGLSEYNSETNSFKRIGIFNPDKLQFGEGASTVIEEVVDSDTILWIDTYGGFVRMNLNSGESLRFTHNEKDPNSIIDNQINKIIKDRSGVLWLATESGISFLTAKSTKFNSILNSEFKTFLHSMRNKKDLNAIYQNKNKEYWFGFSEGIVKLKYNNEHHQIINSNEINGLNVWSLLEDDNNFLWIGTYGQGLIQYEINSGKRKKWNLEFKAINISTVQFIKSLFQDSKNKLWVGYWGSGLGRIDLSTGYYDLWTTKINDPHSISYTDVWTIKEDKLGRIWIGVVGGGLNLFVDKEGGKFRHWINNVNDTNTLSNNNVYSICIAKNKSDSLNSETILWIGTGDGLNKFLIKNNPDISDIYNFDVEIESYNVDDGLTDNSVNSILEDDEKNLWLGTGSGISFFNTKEKTFTNFSSSDGLIGKVMNPGAALKIDNGLMLFGSKKGLNIFNPEQIKLSSYKPNLVITDFLLFNKSFVIGKGSPLKFSSIKQNEIKLSHDQDVFSFEFAALDYNSSESIQYAYKMEGFDKEWVYSGTRRFVTYTNLDPGEYEFKVKSTNADGIWNDNITSINIIMSPPWWRTTWAYGLYIVLILLGLLGIRQFELSRTKLRNELRLREIEVRNKSELEEVKSRFFANLSHEFRTPLMLIKGPLEQIKNNGKDKSFSESIELIERNSDRLQRLIDQLLELSQLEKAAIPLKAKRINLVSTLKGLLASFESLAIQKNIDLKFESDLNYESCWIDQDKFEKIINNLLSNAFKFTSQGGKVIVTVGEILLEEKQFAEIKISDTGSGIAKDKIDKIFDRFFQVDNSNQRSYGGSGIGLALVKEFVDLHKWKISVDSVVGQRTEFKIQIPMWEDYLSADEKIDGESNEIINDSNINKSKHEKPLHKSRIEKQVQLAKNSNSKPSLLIVDDSEDVRKYLSGLLGNDYKVLLAKNGEEGIKIASETNPDLIISDVMMPSMDGMEFCNKIKSNWMTSDIPVILLTAKASTESKLEGLEIGADDYLTKPFDSRELFTRIKNLLEQRRRLRDKYNKDLGIKTETSKLNSADSEFIDKTLELLEKNIDKTNFGTEQLAKELFVSRTQLHRKILTITGQAPGEFIRIFKLKRAAQLLLNRKFSVTQVAYEIGFSSPAQFTRAFTKQFNCLPSEFPSLHKTFS